MPWPCLPVQTQRFMIFSHALGVITTLAQELFQGAGAFGEKIVKGKANGNAARTRRQPAAAAQA